MKAAVEAGQRQVMVAGGQTAESMAKRAAEAVEFARSKSNPMAMVKALELEAKLYGLLIDRVDQRSVGSLTVEIMQYSGDA